MTLCQFQTQALKSLEASTSDGKECACNAGDSVRSLDQEDPLEKGMATHSSILAWRISMDSGAWQVTVHGVTESQK